MGQYYVYIIKDCESLDDCYIGKGKLERAYRQIFQVNGKDRMENFYSLGGNPTDLLRFYSERLEEKEAYAIEKNLILEYKNNGSNLMNKMSFSPHTKTKEWKEKIRLSNIGKHNHFADNNPNAKECVYVPDGTIYKTLKQLCESNNLPYSSVKTSLWNSRMGKKSKYSSIIEFI